METRGNKRRLELLEPSEEDANEIDTTDIDSDNSAASNETKRKKTIPRILDGEFFTIVSEITKSDGKIKIVAKCKICQEEKQGCTSSTGNFLKHYQLKHSSMVEKVKAHINNKTKTAVESSLKQPTLQKFVSNQEQVRNHLIRTLTIKISNNLIDWFIFCLANERFVKFCRRNEHTFQRYSSSIAQNAPRT